MQKNIALWIVAIAMGIAIIPTMPYGYYLVMRWVVCPICAWLAALSYQSGAEKWAWTWGVTAAIYNPIIPVHSTREFWLLLNLATIGLSAWYGLKTPHIKKGI